MESLYAISRNAKQRCSRDRGARAWLLPGVCWFLGIVQLPRSGVKHVMLFLFALVKFFMPVAVVFSVCSAAHHLLWCDSSLAARIASSQYSWDSPDFLASSSSSRNCPCFLNLSALFCSCSIIVLCRVVRNFPFFA